MCGELLILGKSVIRHTQVSLLPESHDQGGSPAHAAQRVSGVITELGYNAKLVEPARSKA